MAEDEERTTPIRERRQYHLRTLFLVVTGVAVACAVLHYVGAANAIVLILVFGPTCLVALAVILIAPAAVAI